MRINKALAGGALGVGMLLAACGSSGGGVGGLDDNAVQSFVASNLSSSVTGVASAPSDETVTIDSNTCVQATGNSWNCTVQYKTASTADPTANGTWSATLVVTCDDSGNCSWPAVQPLRVS